VGVHRAPDLALSTLYIQSGSRGERKNEKQKTDDPNTTAAGDAARRHGTGANGEPRVSRKGWSTAQELRAKFLEKKEIEITNN
jgi:hypothetical protein